MITSAPSTAQELHSRVNDGILVRLMWRAQDGHLFVAVNDSKTDEDFCVAVHDRACALDVFHHPFAYAAHYGVLANPTGGPARVCASVS